MSKTEIVTAVLDEHHLARLDTLAGGRRLTREEMLAQVVRSGLQAIERGEAAPASTPSCGQR